MSFFNGKLPRFVLVVLICFVVMDTTYGACCRKFKEKYCKDCTKGTPCCGHNKCNIFCCGCRCRREPIGKDCVVNQGACECYKEKGKRSAPFPTTDMSAYVTFMDLDINKLVYIYLLTILHLIYPSNSLIRK